MIETSLELHMFLGAITFKYIWVFFLIDNKNFIEEKEQCVYDCKLITLETNTIKSKREPNREKEIRQ